MLTVEVTREVAVPVEVVWRTFTDLANRPAWLSTVESAELLTGPEFEVGTRWRETRFAAQGFPLTEEIVVVDCDPGRGCVLYLRGVEAEYRLVWRFRPIEVGRHRGGCSISTVLVGSPLSRASRLFAFFLGGFAARTVEGALRSDLDSLALASLDLLKRAGAESGGEGWSQIATGAAPIYEDGPAVA